MTNEDSSKTTAEMANFWYHSMVQSVKKGAKVEEILEILGPTFSQSGIEEKNNRKSRCND